MITKIEKYSQESIKLASRIIREGGLVAFKTETVYGLGANAYDSEALAKVYEVKGRPSDNPLIAHISSADEADKVARDISPIARQLMLNLMPGPITIVLNRADSLPERISGGRSSIAVRVPLDEWARKFIEECGVPIAAPSANTSTRPSPTSANHVLSDLNGKIPLILDGGNCEVGLESTVVDARGEEIILLRHGGVAVEDIERVIGRKVVTDCIVKEIVSPGTKYRHYAPKIPLTVAERNNPTAVINLVRNNSVHNLSTVIIGLEQDLLEFGGISTTYSIGKTASDAAHNLFGALRELELIYDYIIAVRLPDEGLGASVNSRLDKAAAIM